MKLSSSKDELFPQNLLDTFPEAMLIMGSDGRIRRVNAQMESLFGYHSEEIIGQEIEMLLPEVNRVDHIEYRIDYFNTPKSRQMRSGIEFTCKMKNGQEFYSDISLSPIEIEGQWQVFCSIRDITNSVDTRATLAEKVKQLETINEVGLAVSSTQDVDSLLRLIVEQSAEIIGVASCAVLLPDIDTGELVFSAAIDDVVGLRVPTGEGIVSRVLKSGKPEIISDVTNDPAYYQNIGQESNIPIHSMMVIPLIVDGKSIGALTAVNKINGVFSEDDCELLVTLASYAATSIKNAQLYDQVQRYAQELEVEVAKRTDALRSSQNSLKQRNLELNRLYRASETLVFTSAPVLEEIAEIIVKTVLAEFGKSNCSILISEPGINEIMRIAVQGPYADEVSKGVLSLDGVGLVPRAMRTGKIINISDVREELDYVPNWKDARSELAIPLKRGDEVIGVIDVQSTELNAFDHDDERLMGIFAERAALAIENVRLFEAERHLRIEAETLREASAVVAGSLNQDEAINEILVQLERVVSYDSASVQLLEGGHLEIVGGRGWPDPNKVLGMQFPIPGDNPNSVVIQQSKALILDQTSEYQSVFNLEPHSQIRSWLGVPLRVRDKVIGMLAIDHSNPNFFDSEHIRIATAFADQVAITIDNARLFGNTQSTLAETQVLYHIAQALIHSESLWEVLQNLVENISQFLPAHLAALHILDIEKSNITETVIAGAVTDEIELADFDELMDGLTGWSIRELKPAYSPKGSPDPRESAIAQKRRSDAGYGSVVIVPLIYRGNVLGSISVVNRDDQPDFSNRDIGILETIANQAAIAIENARLFEEIQWLATTDELTGIHNRRHFFELGRLEIERARRYGHSLSAIMLDIDNFKKVNDTFGHSVGDQVLRELAQVCLSGIREFDILGRYGGEEFAVVLPETQLSEACITAERLRQLIKENAFNTTAGDLSVTISLGVAEFSDEITDLATLLDLADSALYVAKQAGRNCVKFSV